MEMCVESSGGRRTSSRLADWIIQHQQSASITSPTAAVPFYVAAALACGTLDEPLEGQQQQL